MRELTVLVAFSLGTIFAAEAPRLSIDSQTVSGGDVVVMLRNESHVSATAYVVGLSDKHYTTTDTLLGARSGRPLLYGDVEQVRVRGGGGEARVMAAVFEDGATEGDQRWVTQLLTHRQAVFNDIPRALTLLKMAVDQRTARPAAAFWFRQWNDQYRAARNGETNPVPLAAEMLLHEAKDQSAERPARDLTRVFEELFTRLRESKPQL